MTGRPPRDVHDEAKRALTRRLQREGCAVPELLATELLAVLAGHQIGLTDTSRPADPGADWHPPTNPTSGPSDEFRAARQALKGTQQ